MEPRSAERGNVELSPELHVVQHASMEPRSAERGNANWIALRYEMCWRLQWSHAQPNVETDLRRHDLQPGPALQWSHAQPNVETRDRDDRDDRAAPASMEPRSAERGNASRARRSASKSLSFNGATLSRTWKPVDPLEVELHGPRFNGATLSRTWKHQRHCQCILGK